MSDNVKDRESLEWAGDNQAPKHWTGFNSFILGPMVGLYMVSKIREFLE
jgi:hypothetical protein